MKTAQELFTKYEIIAPDEGDEDGNEIPEDARRTDCMFYDDFLLALTEHDAEIVKIIDEMESQEMPELTDQQFALYSQGYNEALKELKIILASNEK